MKEKCLAQEHNTISPARAQTWTVHCGVKRTNHEATTPPMSRLFTTSLFMHTKEKASKTSTKLAGMEGGVCK